MEQSFEEFVERNDAENHFYNVSVYVIEASNLVVENMISRVSVQLGNKKRFTKIKESSDKPYYNEYFVFDYYGTLDDLLELLLTISLYRPSHGVKRKKLLGSARFDLATIWIQPGHQISQKWIILTDPDDPTGKIQGYLKCDIAIVSPEEPLVTHLKPRVKETDKEYFIPEHQGSGKLSARYIIRIHSGTGLFADTDIHFWNRQKRKWRTFVRLYFAGLSANTSKRYKTRNPVWNEEIIFTEKFPPLYNRLRIELHLTKHFFATRYINLSDISNPTVKGFMPVYGPTYLHFYDPPYNYSGALLITIETKTVSALREKEKLLGVKRIKISEINQSTFWSTETFVVYAIIYEITMLDKKATNNKVLNCVMSFGDHLSEDNNVNKSADADLIVSEMDYQYNYIEIGEVKYGFWIKKKLPDSRNRLFLSNLLHYIYANFRRNLIDAHSKSESSPKQAESLLQHAFSVFKSECIEFKNKSFPGVTNLHKQRLRMINLQLKDAIDIIDHLSGEVPFHYKFKTAIKILKQLEGVIEDPQDSFPYVIFKLRHSGNILAYVKVPVRDILYSSTPKEKGRHCGRIQHLFFHDAKKPSKALGKMEVFLWFSTYNSFGFCLDHIPRDYEDFGHEVQIPLSVTYIPSVKWICRAHISQAQIEPCNQKHCFTSVKIILGTKTAETNVVKHKLSPVWNETILIDNLVFCPNKDYIYKSPPGIIVEVWNREKKKYVNLVGTFIAFPTVYLADSKHIDYPPPLQWFTITSNKVLKGELLAMFEMIEVTDNTKSEAYEIINTIPAYITPKVMKYRLEVLFWGMRTNRLKMLNLLNYPKVVINYGDITLSADIRNASKLPNFDKPPLFADIEIPENITFTPPLNIRLYNNQFFGHLEYLGSHTVYDIKKFIVYLIPKDKWVKESSRVITIHRDMAPVAGQQLSEENMPDKRLVELKISEPPKMYDIEPRREQHEHYRNERFNLCKWFCSRCIRKKPFVKPVSEPIKSVQPDLLEYIRLDIPDPDLDEDYFDWWSKYNECLDRITKTKKNTKSSVSDVDTSLQTDRKDEEIFAKSKISQIIIYPNELEQQPEFQGLNDTLRTYDFPEKSKFKCMKLKCTTIDAKFKGAICMYKLDEGKFVNHFGREVNNETPYYYVLSTRARDIKSVVLRVYVVRCHKLHPKDVHGSVDPYIEIRTNSTIISDSKNHIVKDTNPIFGRCYEVDARLPFDSILTVRVMDWDRLSSDFVGETVIDIENRFYSRHRARCGIQQIYNESGYNKWRANFKPTQILSKLCGRYNLEKPLYHGHSVTVANKTFTTAETENVQENAALTALRFWDKLPIIGCSFVKEHVETRSLYDPKYPGVEQGKIEMWLDILLNEPGVPLPPMVDISPRIPEPYELRVIVWSTSKVVMKDKSVTHGKMNTDIYIKSWMQGKQDMQKTDVHYNALKGEGLFNWRFIFNFAHVREEKMVIFNYDGLNTYGNQKVPPILIIQLWDCERFHPNEYLGTLSFDIHRIPLPIRETTKALNIDKHFMENSKTIDLLKIKYLRGWWPVMTNRPKYGNRNMVGLIELEFHLLTADEAESFPAGKGRNEPEALPVPLRPSVQWSLWVVPFRALWVYVFGYHKRTIIISLIIFAIALFILIFVYSFPQYSVKKLLNT